MYMYTAMLQVHIVLEVYKLETPLAIGIQAPAGPCKLVNIVLRINKLCKVPAAACICNAELFQLNRHFT